MDYEKEYQNALERAKKGLPLDEVFPELKESEDERIRKELIAAIDKGRVFDIDKDVADRWIAYLEKHKEQQPAGWSEEDENAFLFLYVLIDSGFTEKFINAQKASDMKKWLNTRFKSIRPPHWKPSEEQMAALKNAQYMMSQSGDYYDTTAIINSLITDLQKLL